VQSARSEETFSSSSVNKYRIRSIHSSVHEIKYYIRETFVEKSVNAGHFPYSSQSFYVYHFFLSLSNLLCSFVFYVFFTVELVMLTIVTIVIESCTVMGTAVIPR